MSGVINDMNLPPAEAAMAVVTRDGKIIGQLDVRRSKPWLDWLNSLVGFGKQITVSGGLDFANTAAQSANTLDIVFLLAAAGDVPATAFLVPNWPAAPAGTFFTCRMNAVNDIAVTFHNYSAGAVNPGLLAFDFLIILKK